MKINLPPASQLLLLQAVSEQHFGDKHWPKDRPLMEPRRQISVWTGGRTNGWTNMLSNAAESFAEKVFSVPRAGGARELGALIDHVTNVAGSGSSCGESSCRMQLDGFSCPEGASGFRKPRDCAQLQIHCS